MDIFTESSLICVTFSASISISRDLRSVNKPSSIEHYNMANTGNTPGVPRQKREASSPLLDDNAKKPREDDNLLVHWDDSPVTSHDHVNSADLPPSQQAESHDNDWERRTQLYGI